MTASRFRALGRVTYGIALAAGLVGMTGTAEAAPVVRRANGADAAAIQAAVDQFRTDLGGVNNGIGGSTTSGRREINWDAVPAGASSPNALAANFFNVNSPRGVVFFTNGSGFQVSGTPAEFGNFNANYPAQFSTFSPQKLFTPVDSFIMDVTFRIPGTNVPASVSGFGVVFTDVDVFGPTKVEFFDARGQRIGPVVDSSTAFVGALSFVGVSFNAGERVARVRITNGDASPSSGVEDISNGGLSDVVVMDDIIYGEPQALTAATNLDTSFNADGQAEVSQGFVEEARAIAIQPDGKIVVAGFSDGLGGAGEADFLVVRYNTDGSRDSSFSGDGRINFSFGADLSGTDRAGAVALQADGKIVVAGLTDAGGGNVTNFAVARLTTNGELDSSFDGDGKVTIDFNFDDVAYAIAIQDDGKIVVAGQSAADTAVARLLSNGLLDPDFNPVASPTLENGDGRLRINLGNTDFARAVVVAPDGSIFVAGTGDNGAGADIVVLKLDASGVPAGGFGTNGTAYVNFGFTDSGEDLALLPDGRLVVAGTAEGGGRFAVARLAANGAPDTTFNLTGRATVDIGGVDTLEGLAVQPDGRVVLAGITSTGGGSQNIAVARLTSGGLADTTFASGGIDQLDLGFDEFIRDVALQADGRIVLAGRTSNNQDMYTVRLIGGPPPAVTIVSPTTAITTTSTSPFLALAGTAADGSSLRNITWTTDRGFSGTATGTTAWTADVPLAGGINRIIVTATNANGVVSADAFVVNVSEFAYFLSEGATGSFFDMDVLIANPTATPADVAITYLKPDGTTVPQTFTLAAQSRRTVKVDQVVGVENTAVSAVVRSTNAVPLAVERSMFWDSTYYGGHTGNAVDAPATRWLFGEGNQGFFDTYVLLANANATEATATVTFLVEGGANVVEVVSVPATTRLNVYAGAIPQLIGKSFSIVVTANQPIIAERAMYFGKRLFEGGHESAGVTQASTRWFHAEGATGSYFDTYILVGNPNPTVANLTVTFLKGDGTTLVRSKQVPANGRFTMHVDGEDPSLADTAVSTTVVSDIPVVSERAMYWPGDSSTWFEAHNSFGVTTTATKWALAEGRVGQVQEFETYVLIANPSASTATVRATFLRANGQPPVVKSWDVLPTSRFNIWVNAMVPELQNEDFGVLLEVQNGVDVAVERALYWKSGGVAFAGGTNATAVRVP